MISFKKSYRRLGIDREELERYVKKLGITPSIKPPRWQFLQEKDFQLVEEAISMIKSGKLRKNQLTREVVQEAIKQKKISKLYRLDTAA